MVSSIVVIFALLIVPFIEKKFYEAVIKETFDLNRYKLPEFDHTSLAFEDNQHNSNAPPSTGNTGVP